MEFEEHLSNGSKVTLLMDNSKSPVMAQYLNIGALITSDGRCETEIGEVAREDKRHVGRKISEKRYKLLFQVVIV